MVIRTAFLFPGQGSYLPGVLTKLDISVKPAADDLAVIDAVAVEYGHKDISPLLFDEASPRLDRLLAEDHERLNIAIFATSVALAEFLSANYRVEPDVVLGHSFGEFAALVVAGALSVENATRALCECHDAIRAAHLPPGGLLAIGLSAARTEHLVADLADESLVVAAENAPDQTVVAGFENGLAILEATVRAMNIRSLRLRVPGIVHHPALNNARKSFTSALCGIPITTSRIPRLSQDSSRYATPEDDVRTALATLLTHRVRFAESLRTLRNDGVSNFVECGARDVLSRIVAHSCPQVIALSPLRRRVDAAELARTLHPVTATIGDRHERERADIRSYGHGPEPCDTAT
jgi:acyl transferase domain-containing protein